VVPCSHDSRWLYHSIFCNTETLIAWAMIGYLDEASLEYKVQSNLSVPVDFFNYTERRSDPIYEAEVVFQRGVASPIRNLDAAVWYHYQFLFHCFYGNAYSAPQMMGQPIQEPNALHYLRQQLNQYLRFGIALVNEAGAFRERSCGLLGLALEDPRYAAEPFRDGPPAPTLVPTTVPRDSDDDGGRTAAPATGERPPARGAPPLDGATQEYSTYTRPMNAQDWVSGGNCVEDAFVLAIFSLSTILPSQAFLIYICWTGLAALSGSHALCEHLRGDAAADARGGAAPPPYNHAPRLGPSGDGARRRCPTEYGMEGAGQSNGSVQ
jgi:hypothetical protein